MPEPEPSVAPLPDEPHGVVLDAASGSEEWTRPEKVYSGPEWELRLTQEQRDLLRQQYRDAHGS